MTTRKKTEAPADPPADTKVPGDLSPYGGRAVIASVIRVKKAGDGLSSALTLDPVEYAIGESGRLLLDGEFTSVTYEEVPNAGGALRRVHTFTAEVGVMVDADVGATMIAEQKERIRKAKDAAKGIISLPLEGDGEPGDGDEWGDG
jgi:hypothetical protein